MIAGLQSRTAMAPVLAVVLGSVAIIVVSLISGWALLSGASRITVVLPLVILIGAAAVVIGLLRFELFLLGAVLIRASLDAVKSGSGAFDTTGLFAIGFAAVAILWLISRRGAITGATKVTWAYALFVAAAGLSVAIAPSIARGGREIARLLAVLILLLVLDQFLTTEKHRRQAMWTLMASALVPIAVGVIQIVTNSDLLARGGFDRVKGTFAHPNPFSTYLVIVTLVAVALIPHLTKWQRWAAIGVAGASAWMVLLTFTRGAWIALLVGLIVIGIIQSRSLLIVLLVVVGATVLFVPSVSERFADLDEATTDQGVSANSLAWRIDTWGDILEAVESPVAGNGLRSSDLVTDTGKLPHNDFLRVYFEMGLVGFAAYVFLLVTIGKTAWDGVRSTKPGFDRGVAVALAAGFTSFLVLSATSNLISQVVILWYMMTLAALGAAVVRTHSKRPTKVAA